METEWVHLDVKEIKAETDKAFLLWLENGREYWIPKSQISDAADYSEGDKNATVSVTQWIVDQKDIEVE